MQRFQESDRPDIPVRQVHFRRDWKVSAIREAPLSGRGASLIMNFSFGYDLLQGLDPDDLLQGNANEHRPDFIF